MEEERRRFYGRSKTDSNRGLSLNNISDAISRHNNDRSSSFSSPFSAIYSSPMVGHDSDNNNNHFQVSSSSFGSHIFHHRSIYPVGDSSARHFGSSSSLSSSHSFIYSDSVISSSGAGWSAQYLDQDQTTPVLDAGFSEVASDDVLFSYKEEEDTVDTEIGSDLLQFEPLDIPNGITHAFQLEVDTPNSSDRLSDEFSDGDQGEGSKKGSQKEQQEEEEEEREDEKLKEEDKGISKPDSTSEGSKKPVKENRKKGGKRVREPRVALITKSEVEHLEDGYRWRKYGQKAVKNSPFPRNYYRCTNATCGLRKRVERCAGDPSLVITTYEGRHTHPSPTTLRNGSTFHDTNSYYSNNDINRFHTSLLPLIGPPSTPFNTSLVSHPFPSQSMPFYTQQAGLLQDMLPLGVLNHPSPP